MGATKEKRKFSLEQMETTIQVLASINPKERMEFVSKVDELKKYHGKALDERLSKASLIEYMQRAALVRMY